MKWVKASERLPQKWHSRMVVRFIHTGIVICHPENFLTEPDLDVIEWLDESLSPASNPEEDELVKAQDEYIEFLSDEISRTASYLHVHNIKCPDEIVRKGEELREMIKKAKVQKAHNNKQ